MNYFLPKPKITLEQWVKTHCYKIICDILRCTLLGIKRKVINISKMGSGKRFFLGCDFGAGWNKVEAPRYRKAMFFR